MSNWTVEEVNELMDKNGGGNAAAVHIWLGKAPKCGSKYPGGARPKEGDRIEIFKQFVLDAYEYGKFRADTPYEPGVGTVGGGSAGGSLSNSASVSPASSKPSTPMKRPPQPAPTNYATANLLDDSLETTTTQFQNMKMPPPPPTSNSSSASFDPFGTNSKQTSSKQSDPFQNGNSNSTFDPFGTSQPATQTSAPVAAPPTISAPTSVGKPSSSSRQQQAPNLLDFSDPTPVQTTNSSKGSISPFNSDFKDFLFDAQPATSQPQQAPSVPAPTLQQPHPSAAFDPFGGNDLLTPVNTGSGSQSPVKTNGSNAMNPYPNPPVNPFLQSQPPLQSYQPSINRSNVDPFSGMTFDNSGKNTNYASGMGASGMQSTGMGLPMQNQSWQRQSPMMNSSSAISQIDSFISVSGNNSQSNSGKWNNQSSMPSAIGYYARGIPNPPPQQNNSAGSFDFLQETMKKHLNDSSYQNKQFR